MPEFSDDILQNLAKVSHQPVEWVWDGYIPAGYLTVLMGETPTA